jgi:coatomer subunit epsilon
LYFHSLAGAYKSIADLTLPDPSSPDYDQYVLYKIRSLIALGNTPAAIQLVPTDTEKPTLKAALALAKYVGGEDTLEELRDLVIEVEGDEEGEVDADEIAQVKVLAATAFARAGEVEEALETLGAGTETENLEACVYLFFLHCSDSLVDLFLFFLYANLTSLLSCFTCDDRWPHSVAYIVQIYLSIHRPDLARKEFERAKRWAEDDLLLSLIEASIVLVTGKDRYGSATSFYTEQIANPSLSAPHLLTARGVARLLRNEYPEARSDLEEALTQQKSDADTLAASVVAAGLEGGKSAEEAEGLWRYVIFYSPPDLL